MSGDEGSQEATVVNKNKRHRKDKPWDTDDIDHWKIEPFTQTDNPAGAFATESSFATLFPRYREKYLRESWGAVTRALEPLGIACNLDLIHGSMLVRTTRKTFDPFALFKARDLIKLLARGVALAPASRVLADGVACDIIKIGGVVRNKERFVKRRQRIIGPDGSTLKAIELLTQCYVLVQGNTVSAIGPHKALKEVRRIVLDCMKNIHPIYRIKELMIRRELAKDPALATESWDRFLPKFRRRHLTSAEKSARRRGHEAPNHADAQGQERADIQAGTAEKEQAKPKKKVYTPFPPPQLPRKIDLQLESGEYFLKPKEREVREAKERKARQEARAVERRKERAEVFVAPVEDAERTIEEKKLEGKKRKEREDLATDGGEKKKKKRKAVEKDDE